ncbi:MAG: GAF domain-containing protein [Gemmatimonadota bacterium]|nr:GAF domain-containing protein [Gemmatimonadota bacterium]
MNKTTAEDMMAMTPIHEQTAASQRLPNQEGRADSSSASGANASSEFVAVLERSGLHDALRYLNGRVRFRFTGVYRCDKSVLIIQSLCDRENPSVEHCGEIRQLKGTFCSIVLATGEPFATGNAPADPLLEKYPLRHTVISYSGVPIRTPTGRIGGVLCHYDFRPRLLPPGEQKILASVTPYLAQYVDGARDAETAPTAKG